VAVRKALFIVRLLNKSHLGSLMRISPTFFGLTMQRYLFIGGGKDGLSFPAPDGAETVQMPVGVTDSETYVRESLSVGDASITIYRHKSLAPEQVLNRLVDHYKAWCVNRPGGCL
jgi:hypothetical protein